MADVNKDVSDDASLLCDGGASNNIIDKYIKNGSTSSAAKLNECFQAFDVNGDGFLDKDEFHHFLKCVFCNKGLPFELTDKQEEDLLKFLDEDQDGKLSLSEFRVCWHHWLKQILEPVSALLIIDVQNDFISGTLALKDCPAGQDGADVIPVINRVLEQAHFDVVVYTGDWHPEDHISFVENVHKRRLHHTCQVRADKACKLDTVIFEGPPITEQKLWPAHCVQNTWGAKQHETLKKVDKSIHINKGTSSDIDSYSAFWDNKKLKQTELVAELTKRRVTDVYVCGLAYDVCVGETASHALEHGFRTVLIEDGCRGVSLEDIDKMRTSLLHRGAAIVQSADVADMVAARSRRPELGRQAALNVALARRIVSENQSRHK